MKGLEERPVSLPSEILALLHEGDLRRRTGATDWNERSSRSHSVFVVVRLARCPTSLRELTADHCDVEQTIESTSNNGEGVARTSRLVSAGLLLSAKLPTAHLLAAQNLIDLAGSESATGQDERRKEGSFINKSYVAAVSFPSLTRSASLTL